MLILRLRKEATVQATPQRVFDIVADVERHSQLAGSGEVLTVRKLTPGPVKAGTRFEANENIKMGPGRQKFVAQSEVVEYDPPKVVSWTSRPPGSPKPKRIQWWFRVEPEAGGARVTHEVQVDMGLIPNLLFYVPYRLMRAGTISKGMTRTLENVKRLAEEKK